MDKKLDICERLSCNNCRNKKDLDFDFTMAFQPIINCSNQSIYGYEALVRGLNNEPAYSIFSKVNDKNRYLFDQLCRIKAIALASELGITSMLSINFLPNAVYEPARCIRTTLEAAKKYNFPADKIMFEFTEVEKIEDSTHVQRIIAHYQSLGFKTAVDDFGSGYSGLNLLADFHTDIVKFDMGLVRNVDCDITRQSIITNCLNIFRDLDVTPLAEGIESYDEYIWLKNAGVELMQGYFFAKPELENLPSVNFMFNEEFERQ
jgi:EAL domain-containing protein (putative c-di-GMP-specific phosphodiesterase class I)